MPRPWVGGWVTLLPVTGLLLMELKLSKARIFAPAHHSIALFLLSALDSFDMQFSIYETVTIFFSPSLHFADSDWRELKLVVVINLK